MKVQVANDRGEVVLVYDTNREIDRKYPDPKERENVVNAMIECYNFLYHAPPYPPAKVPKQDFNPQPEARSE